MTCGAAGVVVVLLCWCRCHQSPDPLRQASLDALRRHLTASFAVYTPVRDANNDSICHSQQIALHSVVFVVALPHRSTPSPSSRAQQCASCHRKRAVCEVSAHRIWHYRALTAVVNDSDQFGFVLLLFDGFLKWRHPRFN
jgi:hypothetical protein